jgi:hypothetical protein
MVFDDEEKQSEVLRPAKTGMLPAPNFEATKTLNAPNPHDRKGGGVGKPYISVHFKSFSPTACLWSSLPSCEVARHSRHRPVLKSPLLVSIGSLSPQAERTKGIGSR